MSQINIFAFAQREPTVQEREEARCERKPEEKQQIVPTVVPVCVCGTDDATELATGLPVC